MKKEELQKLIKDIELKIYIESEADYINWFEYKRLNKELDTLTAQYIKLFNEKPAGLELH